MKLLLVATHAREGRLEMELPLGVARVGRGRGEKQLALRTDGISYRHARFERTERGITVVDESSTNGTFVNGTLAPAGVPTPITPLDIVTILEWVLTVEEVCDERFVSRAPREHELLDALMADPADVDLRLVYADWLEENGYAAESETMRLVDRTRGWEVMSKAPAPWRVHVLRLLSPRSR